MTNQDFDQSDGETLAEFAELEKNGSIDANGNFMVDRLTKDMSVTFMPWSIEAPQWQLYRLLDAVRDKGITASVINHIYKNQHQTIDRARAMLEAPPEAICSAILRLEETK